MPTIHQIYTNNISMRGTDKVKRDNRNDDKPLISSPKHILVTTGIGALGGFMLETDYNPVVSTKACLLATAAGGLLGFTFGLGAYVYNKLHKHNSGFNKSS